MATIECISAKIFPSESTPSTCCGFGRFHLQRDCRVRDTAPLAICNSSRIKNSAMQLVQLHKKKNLEGNPLVRSNDLASMR